MENALSLTQWHWEVPHSCLTKSSWKPPQELTVLPKRGADGQKEPFLKGLLGSSQGKKTQAESAQRKSLGSFNTSVFDPKCALLSVNRGDQHVLCLLI